MNFPIRTEIEILPGDSPITPHAHSRIVINSKGKIIVKNNRVIGFTVKEIIGFSVINTKAIKKIRKLINE